MIQPLCKLQFLIFSLTFIFFAALSVFNAQAQTFSEPQKLTKQFESQSSPHKRAVSSNNLSCAELAHAKATTNFYAGELNNSEIAVPLSISIRTWSGTCRWLTPQTPHTRASSAEAYRFASPTERSEKNPFETPESERSSDSSPSKAQTTPTPQTTQTPQPTATPQTTAPQTTGYVRPTAKKRFQRYVNDVVGPFSLVGYAAVAGISHLTDNPEEWEDDFKGYGRRFASNFGQSAIRATTTYALEEAFRLDGRFYKSQKTGFKARLKDALLSNITARKPDGRRVFGFPRVIGVYTGAVVSRTTWFPDRFGYDNGLINGSISLAAGFAINIFREFVFNRR